METKELNVHMEKVIPTWWRCMFAEDIEIDATMVDSSQKVEDYDAETQAAIRKIMFENNQR